MLNFIKIIEENRKLKELVTKQHETLLASLRLNAQYEKENARLRERINNSYWHNMQCPTHEPDVIFPNTDERGLGEGDTPSDLSPLDM